MSLQIVIARPPNFDVLDRAFGIGKMKNIVITYGGVIYNPDGAYIDAPLLAHEEVHSQRQLASGDVDAFVDRYIKEVAFRFEEEVAAHIEEWRVVRETFPLRAARRDRLRTIAKRLSSPLYGNMVSYADARRLVARKGPVE